MSAKRVYDFGPFRLDPTERRLLRHDQPVALTPKCFDLLVILVENSGHLISKEELLERLWPDQFVEESNLSFNISTLRKALGEAGHGDHFIETVPKKGFRFVAHVDLREDDEIDVSRIRQETLTSTNVQQDIVPAYSSAPARFGPKVRIIAGIFCALAVVIICYGIWFRRVDAPTRNSPRTIAVLPFKPLSPESRNESLEMGMAEALITRLSNINQLVVRPLSSVRKYGDVQQDPIKAGQEVEADAVLDGSIQRVGDRMRVTVRLIDVRTGATILSEPFDAQFSDIFNLQDSISQRMTKALSLKLTGDEIAQLTKHDTNDADAYQLALLGDYFLEKQNGERRDNLKKSLEYYQKAVEKDPNFARAYIGISEFYISDGDPKTPVLDRVAKAKAAVLRALELDNGLAEAHIAFAELKYQYEFDWTGAGTEFERAV
ncbi:MAG TPA: winged helix-turn-helix domain-containing protein, partial [Pyrinomonadaceae bacterium]|nr:winged helix-turn-helix domain-containing protein [Pyrinomonadaceae bacterium]